MKKVHNFCAGPCILPKEVFEQASKAVLNFNDSGLSILEISHRSEAFVEIINSARSLLLNLLNLNTEEYSCLFLHGGASLQFLMVAQNFLKKDKKAGYLDTGTWSSKAIKEAQLFGDIKILASSKDKDYTYIPKSYHISDDLGYIHYTSNNTIFGTQMKTFPKNKESLIFCDMSSDILSRDIDYSQFDLIYAGAQKNIGPAGTGIIVLKKELIKRINPNSPSLLNYKVHIDKESMFHTPPVFSIYVSYLNLIWLKDKGMDTVFNENLEKSKRLYSEIDRNKFIQGISDEVDRSMMNITFRIPNKYKSEKFDELCNEYNISGIKGHRSVGGYRASLYNALNLESVDLLVEIMKKLS